MTTHPLPIPRDPDTKTVGAIRVPYKTISGVAGAVVACIFLFNMVVPSKATVEAHDVRIHTIEQRYREDHDALVKLSGDVEYIRRWVEAQERLQHQSLRSPRQQPWGNTNQPLP